LSRVFDSSMLNAPVTVHMHQLVNKKLPGNNIRTCANDHRPPKICVKKINVPGVY